MLQKTIDHKDHIWTILFPYKKELHGDLSQFELFRIGSLIVTFFPKNDKLLSSKEWDILNNSTNSVAAMKTALIEKGTIK